jgi:hypothetical protein
VVSNSSDVEVLGARLAAVLLGAQWAAVALICAGLALEVAGWTKVRLETLGVGVLVATPFLATAFIALTAGRARARLAIFAVATLALAGLGIVLAA